MRLIVREIFLMNFNFRILEIISKWKKDEMEARRSLKKVRVIIFLLRYQSTISYEGTGFRDEDDNNYLFKKE